MASQKPQKVFTPGSFHSEQGQSDSSSDHSSCSGSDDEDEEKAKSDFEESSTEQEETDGQQWAKVIKTQKESNRTGHVVISAKEEEGQKGSQEEIESKEMNAFVL